MTWSDACRRQLMRMWGWMGQQNWGKGIQAFYVANPRLQASPTETRMISILSQTGRGPGEPEGHQRWAAG